MHSKSQSLLSILAVVVFLITISITQNVTATPIGQASPPTAVPTIIATPTPSFLVSPAPLSIQIQRNPQNLVLASDKVETVTLQINAHKLPNCIGAPRKPVDAIFVIDISTSAGRGTGSNWEQTQQWLLQLIDTMSQPVFSSLNTPAMQSRIGMVTSRVEVEGEKPILLSELTTNYQSLRDLISKADVSGDSQLAGGIELAVQELERRSSTGHAPAIILMLHDNVVLNERTIEAIKTTSAKIPVYLVINNKNIAPGEQITREQAQSSVDNRFLIDPKPLDLHHLFFTSGQGDPTFITGPILIREEFAPATLVRLEAPDNGGQIINNSLVWALPPLNTEGELELSYRISAQPQAQTSVKVSTIAAYIDCNGFPQLQPSLSGEISFQSSIATPTNQAIAVTEQTSTNTPVPPGIGDRDNNGNSGDSTNSDGSNDGSKNDGDGTALPPISPPWLPIDISLLMHLLPWIIGLIFLLLLAYLLWRFLAGRARKGTQAPPPPPPLPPIKEGDLVEKSVPTWVQNATNDTLAALHQPVYPVPSFQDTLIIGAGQVGAMVLDQLAQNLEQRFAHHENVRHNVHLLYIDIQPQDTRTNITSYQIKHLNSDQIVQFQPDFVDIDDALRNDPLNYQHWKWWSGNSADDYGRAAGRMALFFDLRHGTERSQLWQKLKQSFAVLQNPSVWIVGSTFDDMSSGLTVDLAWLSRLIGKEEASLLLALPARHWNTPDLSEQSARSIATLREIERLMRNTDVPFIYNPNARQEVLDRWLERDTPLAQVYLFDAHGAHDMTDLTGVAPQDGIAAMMSDSLLALCEQSVNKLFRDQLAPLFTAAGSVINQAQQSIVGSLGCFSVTIPFEPLQAALEWRAAHEVLFDTIVGLIPQGSFDNTASWNPEEVLSAEHKRFGVQDADQFLNRLGIDPLQIRSLDKNKAASLRQCFPLQLRMRVEALLNNEDSALGSNTPSSCFIRSYAFLLALVGRLEGARQSGSQDLRQCLLWAQSLRNELQQWLERMVGSLDGGTPDRPPLVDISQERYQQQRDALQQLWQIRVRQPALDETLDIAVYRQIFRSWKQIPAERRNEPLLRIRQRIGWTCQEPDANQTGSSWQLRMIVLPADIQASDFRRFAYTHDDQEAILAAIRSLASIFTHNASYSGIVSTLNKLHPNDVRLFSQPRLHYNDSEVTPLIGKYVQFQEHLIIATPPEANNSQLIDHLKNNITGISINACASTNPYQCQLLRIVYPIPLRITTAFNAEAWLEYYSSSRLHVFTPEQHALTLEGSRILSDKKVRLSADVVQLFAGEEQELVELFALCWMYGLFQINPRTEQYQVELHDGQTPDPVLAGEKTPTIREALEDAVSYRHQKDRLSVLSRTNRAGTIRRIEATLQEQRNAIGDRVARMEKLEQLRRQYIQPLYTDSSLREIAYLMDVLIDRERR